MEKEFNLSEKQRKDGLFKIKDIKEKIQNVERRLKGFFNSRIRVWTTDEILEEIDKIFSEEFGDELIK